MRIKQIGSPFEILRGSWSSKERKTSILSLTSLITTANSIPSPFCYSPAKHSQPRIVIVTSGKAYTRMPSIAFLGALRTRIRTMIVQNPLIWTTLCWQPGTFNEDVRKKKTRRKRREVTSDEDYLDLDGDRKRRHHRKNRKTIVDSDSEDEERIQKRKTRRPKFESEDESSDKEDKQRKKKSVRKKKGEVLGDEKETQQKVMMKTVDVDVEGIVRKIQGLEVDDSEYAVCYFKLLEAKLTVAQLLPSLFQHMRNALVQQAATYPNNIPIPGQQIRSLNCHFCGAPGCRIGTCEIVNEYTKAGRVVCDGRMVLYTDKSPIAWNSQGLRILVDAHFGGPLLVPAGTPKDQETARIQMLFVSGMLLEDEEDVSEEQGVEKSEEDVPVAAFATTRFKAKNIPSPNSVEKPISMSSKTTIPSEKHPDRPLPAAAKKNPAYTYESKAFLLDALATIKKKILDSLVSGITVADLMSISPELHKETMEYCKTQQVPVVELPELSPSALVSALIRLFQVEFAEPLRKLKVIVNGKKEQPGLLNGGSEIVLIREDLWKEVGASVNVKRKMMMEAANRSTSELPGCVEMLEIDVEGLKTWAHAFIVSSAPYWLLLGCPWHRLVCLKQKETEDSVLVTIHDPCDPMNICTCNTTP